MEQGRAIASCVKGPCSICVVVMGRQAKMGGMTTRPEELKCYWNLWQTPRLSIKNGLIWYKWMSEDETYQWKLLIPKAYQRKVLQMLHNDPSSGHFGEVRSVMLMNKAHIYWFSCFQHMRLHCRCCDDCLCEDGSGCDG